MSDDLDLSGDDDEPSDDEPKTKPDAPKSRRGRSRRKTSTTRTPRAGPSETELRKRIDDGLDEVVGVIAEWFGWPDVAEVMRADQQRMAEVLAARATRHKRVAAAVVLIFGKDSALAIARAFGPTLRAVRTHFREWREERAAGDQPEIRVDGDGWILDPYTGQRTGERAAVA